MTNKVESAVYQHRVDKDLALFEHHFPGDPLVPGALICHWVCVGLRRQTSWSAKGISNIKFFKPLRPADDYRIEYTIDSDKQMAKFICYVDTQIICKGSMRIQRISNE